MILLAAFSSSAQITLEHTYEGPGDNHSHVHYSKLSNGDVIYYHIDRSINEFRAYNEDHSIRTTVDISSYVRQGMTANVYLASDKLFDLDQGLEFMLVTYEYINNPGTGAVEPHASLLVLDESGSALLTKELTPGDGLIMPEQWNQEELLIQTKQGTKLIIKANSEVLIYSLPGSTPSVTGIDDIDSALIKSSTYPNPATEYISIAYEIPSGTTGDIVILNTTGMVIGEYKLDSTFETLLVDVSMLTPGIYSYVISSHESVSKNTFVVI